MGYARDESAVYNLYGISEGEKKIIEKVLR
jgi:hypothetical protein